ncbi:putative phospholipase B-like 2 [Dermacentor andersoni]|uniref:putative phospholipase B-like 2 n=1 Tax=Dermacentor andersoni TaxID=34620 RepID=UPI002417CADA|nr:putative phospholipase B-like 2 [Dermacentor andersoni]
MLSFASIRYFDEIFSISGQPAKVAKYGDYYSYEHCPRAKMLKRDHEKLTDMDSIMTYMWYNDYKNDPLSRCNCTPPQNPAYAIAARYDLLCPDGKYEVPGMYRHGMGGIDVKVTNQELMASLEYVAVSGPTWINVPAFQWSTSGLPDSHVGHPDRWQFKPVQHKWTPARGTPSETPSIN